MEMGLSATVVIGDALDVILFEVVFVLNFNDLKRSFLRVLQATLGVGGIYVLSFA